MCYSSNRKPIELVCESHVLGGQAVLCMHSPLFQGYQRSRAEFST